MMRVRWFCRHMEVVLRGGNGFDRVLTEVIIRGDKYWCGSGLCKVLGLGKQKGVVGFRLVIWIWIIRDMIHLVY